MKRKKAFTLVELLVVISIIALLIALLLPALAQAKQTANSAVCSNNLRQMSMAIQEYQASWSGARFPFWKDTLADNALEAWVMPLAPYITGSRKNSSVATDSYEIDFQKLQSVIICPSTTALPESAMLTKTNLNAGSVTQPWWWYEFHRTGATGAWAQWGLSYFQGSYAFNAWLYGPGGNFGRTTSLGVSNEQYVTVNANPPAYYWPNNISDVPTSTVPAFGDGIWLDGGPLETDHAPPINYVNGEPYPAGSLPSGNMARWCINRHGGNGINMSFMDGHVEHVELNHLWSLNWARDWQIPTAAQLKSQGVSALP